MDRNTLLCTSTRLSSAFDPLTPKELEVATLLSRGNSNEEIAETLLVAIGTVKTHVRSVLSKLGAQNRSQVCALEIESLWDKIEELTEALREHEQAELRDR
jgi:DNA-binding NarL/FixJ family response regulator